MLHVIFKFRAFKIILPNPSQDTRLFGAKSYFAANAGDHLLRAKQVHVYAFSAELIFDWPILSV